MEYAVDTMGRRALKNTLSNVIYELFEQIGLNVFFVMINRNEFVCFLYMQNEFDKEQNGDQYSVIDIDRIIDKCNEFEKFSCTYMKIRQGIYVGKAVKFSELPGELKLLYEKDNNNIGRATGVYQDIDIRQEKILITGIQ